MKRTTQLLAALAIIALGMLGLHNGVEYSGWVLFVGLIAAL
jgi:hypothetical protein